MVVSGFHFYNERSKRAYGAQGTLSPLAGLLYMGDNNRGVDVYSRINLKKWLQSTEPPKHLSLLSLDLLMKILNSADQVVSSQELTKELTKEVSVRRTRAWQYEPPLWETKLAHPAQSPSLGNMRMPAFVYVVFDQGRGHFYLSWWGTQ